MQREEAVNAHYSRGAAPRRRPAQRGRSLRDVGGAPPGASGGPFTCSKSRIVLFCISFVFFFFVDSIAELSAEVLLGWSKFSFRLPIKVSSYVPCSASCLFELCVSLGWLAAIGVVVSPLFYIIALFCRYS
jgi:hypothetical protein